jgi:hypothetical protein
VKLKYVFLSKESDRHPKACLFDVGFILTENDANTITRFLRLSEDLDVPAHCLTRFDIHRTGDTYEFKVCDRCFKRLPTESSFSDNRIKKGGAITKRPSCRTCRDRKEGMAIAPKDRTYWESKRPLDFTPFTCPICNKTTIAGLSKIVLDHCHISGKPRGYVCESCNTGIGRFDDDIKLVYRALKWLERKI